MSDSTVTRFGIGALETARANEAEPGELMGNAAAGLMAINSRTTKNRISYDYIGRFKEMYQAFRSSLIASGNIGRIGKLDVSNDIVNILTSGTIVPTTGLLIHGTDKLKFVRFNLNIDVIDTASGVPIHCDPTVNLAFTVANNTDTNTARTYSLAGTLSDINNRVTVPDYTNFADVSKAIDHNFTLDSFKVTLPDGMDATKVTIILNGILVAFKEVA